ncbi:hypothetical protein [Streptomyces sp. H27-C3]|uniref:hypothetical protein n=1 Tax=Streptomyces sp. H27-C3 TaxID=3046305 RepID=UPI0024BBE4EB|nr:hypothetical protein [Streptomyces sp. H27-C3]MDJ0465977.1 hypothetical protein [Streptomyces sp. H27-C3]
MIESNPEGCRFEVTITERRSYAASMTGALLELQLRADRPQVLRYRPVDDKRRRPLLTLQAPGDRTVQDRQSLLLEVALLQQLLPAGQDLPEHLVHDVFGRAAAAEVDLGEAVEELLVPEEEALEVQGQGQGRRHGPAVLVLGRYITEDAVVTHSGLRHAVLIAYRVLFVEGGAAQQARTESPLALKHHHVENRDGSLNATAEKLPDDHAQERYVVSGVESPSKKDL